MIIYTFQTQTKLEELQKNGFIVGSTDEQVLSYWDNDRNFLDAYRYLAEKMKIKTNPIFAWPNKPDMRKAEYSTEKGKVLLTLDIPENELTFTLFEYWHFVINKWYLPESGVTRDYNWENKRHQNRVTKSWKQIFVKSADEDVDQDIQISFEKLDLKNVVGIKYLGEKSGKKRP